MTVKQFGIGCLAVLALIFGCVVYLLIAQWSPTTVGRYEVRKNRLTGKIQIREGEVWRETLSLAPVGDALGVADLQRITLKEVVWDKDGLLAGTASVAPGEPLKGRFAFQIVVIARNGKRRLVESERNLRRSIDWQGGATVPFILDSEFRPPAFGDKSVVTLVPVLLDDASKISSLPGSAKLPSINVPSPFTNF